MPFTLTSNPNKLFEPKCLVNNAVKISKEL